jgi:acetyl-CoA carboxylase/biotin carboxylase 1
VHPICYYVGGQAPEYRDNKIHTGWLDSRIAMRVRVERPPWHLSVVGGALYKATSLTAASVTEYIGYLEKGQIPPKNISLVNFHIALNIEGIKYTVESIQGGPGSYLLRLNKSEIHAEAHTLRDGGLLVQVYMRSSLSLLLSRCRCSKPLY